MVIHNIYLCSYGVTLSGGEKFTYEVIPRWTRKHLCLNYFGYSALTKEWKANNNIQTINLLKSSQKEKGKLRILILYFVIFFKSLKLIKKFKNKKNVIVSHSDAWPDTLFAFLLKLRNRDAHWIAISHMVLPGPWKGYKYVYTEEIKIPSLIDLYQWLNQRIFFLLQKRADLLVSINPNDRESLVKKNKNVKIIRYGREYIGEPKFDLDKKVYDICFLGRFYEQKGLDEIPEILSSLRKTYDKKLSAIFIGDKNDYSDWLERELKSRNLGYDIRFLGPKYGNEKYNLLKKSRILIFPSYFESFGIVYLDAISVGTPVVEYDLPCFVDHKYGVIKVPFKNNNAFTESLKKLLVDDTLYKKLSFEGYQYSKEFSWDNTAETFERYFEKYIVGMCS